MIKHILGLKLISMASFFSKSTHSSGKPSDADLMSDLVDFHNQKPGITSSTWGQLKTLNGKTSYRILAESLPSDVKDVLDLACGNGPLIQTILSEFPNIKSVIGVDLSEAEINSGRKTISSPKVKWINGPAQELPLEDSSVDCVLSHMALMLMQPLDPVVDEIKRVLRSGGIFSAVISNFPPQKYPTFTELMASAREVYARKIPSINNLVFGDPRVRSPEGLQTLFSSAKGFQDKIELSEFSLIYSDTPENIANNLGNFFYIFELLDSDGQRELQSRWLETIRRSSNTALELPLTKIYVVRS